MPEPVIDPGVDIVMVLFGIGAVVAIIINVVRAASKRAEKREEEARRRAEHEATMRAMSALERREQIESPASRCPRCKETPRDADQEYCGNCGQRLNE